MSLTDRIKTITKCPTCGQGIHAGRCPLTQPAWVRRLTLNAKELAR